MGSGGASGCMAPQSQRCAQSWPNSGASTSTALTWPRSLRQSRPFCSSALRAADLPPIGIHALRHSAATFLIAAGVDVRTVADVLGHASPAFTLSTYVHSSVERQRPGIGKLTRLFDDADAA